MSNKLLVSLLVGTGLLVAGCQPTTEKKLEELCRQLGWTECQTVKEPQSLEVLEKLRKLIKAEYKDDPRIALLTETVNGTFAALQDKNVEGELVDQSKSKGWAYYFNDGPVRKKRIDGAFIYTNVELRRYPCSFKENCENLIRVRLSDRFGPEIDVEVDPKSKYGQKLKNAYELRGKIICGASVKGTQTLIKTGDDSYAGKWQLDAFVINRCAVNQVLEKVSHTLAHSTLEVLLYGKETPENWREYLDKEFELSIKKHQSRPL